VGPFVANIFTEYNQRVATHHNLFISLRGSVLPVVLYGCETWSLKRWEERKLRAFENMVLRRIFGPRRDEVTGE